MDAAKFDNLADRTLKHLMVAIEDQMADEIDDIDLQGSVLTIDLVVGGTYVINKHSATQEIWLSSPKSGAAHFKFAPSKQWLSTREDGNLHDRLEKELGVVLGNPMDLGD